MSLATGTRLGSYEILAPLGAGGMGEVYRARDAKLGRDVAIKILPTAFAADPDRLARFEREAQLLASLNHPHIAQIFGLEGQDGRDGQDRTPFIVMELVEGETLDARLKGSRSLGLPQTLAIARQIAEALDAAHERGIVHRDLKPANIVLTPEGIVKVLDFGLAKAGGSGGSGRAGGATGSDDGLTHSPTVIAPTIEGVLLGTAPYMSPEQARGKAVDKRADIWAFGCVLYEMLTGRRAFAGETTTDVLAKIVERDPEWAALPASTPARIVQLIKRCLEKDPRRRLRDIGDAQIELGQVASDLSDTGPVSIRGRRSASWLVAAGVVLLVALVAVAAIVYPRDGATPDWAKGSSTFAIEAPATPGSPVGLPTSGIAVAPDGRSIAWTAEGLDRRSVIWLYSLGSGASRSLPGTEGALNPFWSPDGQAMAFLAEGSLKIIEPTSGAVRAIARLPESSTGGTWNSQNVIVFSARYGLYQIPASGGTPAVVAELNRSRQENSLRYPRFLPDGRHFLYVARSGRADQSSAYVGLLDGRSVPLFTTTSNVTYAPPGYLLFVKEGALVARTFDQRTFAVGADTYTVVDRIGSNPNGMNGHFDVSPSGVLAYFQVSLAQKSVLRWFDRAGRPLDALGEPSGYTAFRIAPDDVRVAVGLTSDRTVGRDVWVLKPGGAAPTRVTFGGSDDWQPFWSPDGRRVAFMSYRNGVSDLYVKTIDGTAAEEPLVVSEEQKTTGDWSPDGKFVAYWSNGTETQSDVWVSPLEGGRPPIPIARTKFNERNPRFAPDGHFLAYESDESGAYEVYVQPFPPTGGKWQVSVGGGSEASWRRDGRELYYVNSSGMLLTVPVTLSPNGFSTGAAVPLFDVGKRGGSGGNRRYEPASDGRRFLVRQIVDPPPQPLRVMLNWPAALKK